MATITITGDTIRDATGRLDNRPWLVEAATYQDGGAGGVITDRVSRPIYPIAGVISFEIEAGIAAWIEKPDGLRHLVTVPDEDANLWDVIEAGIAYPPDTSQELLAAAVGQYLIEHGDTVAFDAVERDGDTLLFKRGVDTVGDPVDISDLVFDGDMDDITDATAVGKSVVRAATQALARTAIDALSPDDVADEIAAAIAADGTVVDAAAAAAEAAVDADIAGRDLVETDDVRLPGAGDADKFVVMDNAHRVAFQVTDDGETKVGNTAFVSGAPYADDVIRIHDSEDRLAFAVNTDGTVFVGQFADDSDGAEALASLAVTGVHVLIAAGQSNMSGRAYPYGAGYDVDNPRVWQFGSGASEITAATVPLDMVDTPSGLSPITVIAHEYLQRLPSTDVVLIIPCAKGASRLGPVDDTNVNGVWNAAYEGEQTDLYALLIEQVGDALTAAAALWPDADVTVDAMFWHQGEGNPDSFSTQEEYETRFDAIVSGLRTAVSDSSLPVVLGGIIPELNEGLISAVAAGSYDNVLAAHVDTPNRVLRTGYAPGVANAGGYDDNYFHYHRAGVVELAHRMLAAYDRAVLNQTDSEPGPPMNVAAQVIGTDLTVTWDIPPCRYTSFVVEYDDGGGWTAITHSDVSTTATESSVTAPVQVRVSTVNDVGTSEQSAPVYAVVCG